MKLDVFNFNVKFNGELCKAININIDENGILSTNIWGKPLVYGTPRVDGKRVDLGSVNKRSRKGNDSMESIKSLGAAKAMARHDAKANVLHPNGKSRVLDGRCGQSSRDSANTIKSRDVPMDNTGYHVFNGTSTVNPATIIDPTPVTGKLVLHSVWVKWLVDDYESPVIPSDGKSYVNGNGIRPRAIDSMDVYDIRPAGDMTLARWNGMVFTNPRRYNGHGVCRRQRLRPLRLGKYLKRFQPIKSNRFW